MSMHLFTKEKIILICKLKSCWESYWLLFFIPSKSSTRQVSLACCFRKVDLVFMVDFFSIQFGLFSFRSGISKLSKKLCMILFNGQTVTLVRMSLMEILFNFVLSNTLQTRNTHVLQLSADHQGDCFTSCENIISTFIHFRSSQTFLLFPSSHGIDPEYMYMSIESFRSKFTANLLPWFAVTCLRFDVQI